MVFIFHCSNVIFLNSDVYNVVFSFSNIGIQCVTKRDIPESLKKRQSLQVNPFGGKYSYLKYYKTGKEG